jgi:hypothetical protein
MNELINAFIDNKDDWSRLGIISDWLLDQGREVEAEAAKWLGVKKRFPLRYRWQIPDSQFWQNKKIVNQESVLPEPFWVIMKENRNDNDSVFGRLYPVFAA